MLPLIVLTIMLFSCCKPAVAPGKDKRSVAETEFSKIEVLFQPKPPDMPPEWRPSQFQKVITLHILIDESGTPTAVSYDDGPKLLKQIAIEHVMKWRFRPFVQNGAPVCARFKFVLPYK